MQATRLDSTTARGLSMNGTRWRIGIGLVCGFTESVWGLLHLFKVKNSGWVLKKRGGFDF